MNSPIKPISLEYVAAKNKIITSINDAINKHKLPYFFVEEILTNILTSVKNEAKRERDLALAKYQQEMVEFKKATTDENAN